MLPIEKNARTLVGVLVQHFPAGGTCEDLHRQFEKDTSLRRQSFYNALSYCKKQGWIVGGPRHRRDHYQLYILNPNGSWKEPIAESIGEPVGEPLSRDQLEYLADSRARRIEELQSENERLLDWSNGGDAGVALPSLVRIVGDGAASTRQRLKAASAILAFQVQDDGVVEFTKRYLESVCTSTDIGNIDHKVAAAELLRRCESPRVTPDSVRPSYRTDTPEPQEPIEPLADLVARRRARQEAYERELALHPDMDALPSDVCSALNATHARHRK